MVYAVIEAKLPVGIILCDLLLGWVYQPHVYSRPHFLFHSHRSYCMRRKGNHLGNKRQGRFSFFHQASYSGKRQFVKGSVFIGYLAVVQPMDTHLNLIAGCIGLKYLERNSLLLLRIVNRPPFLCEKITAQGKKTTKKQTTILHRHTSSWLFRQNHPLCIYLLSVDHQRIEEHALAQLVSTDGYTLHARCDGELL